MNEVQKQLDAVKQLHGAWTAHNIKLPDGSFTIGAEFAQSDSTRGNYFVELAVASLRKAPADLRVLDLGCLEGAVAVQFAKMGALVDGVDIREESIAKANVVRDILGLTNLRFFVGDALNLSAIDDLNTSYDVIVCAGLLYHIDAGEQLPFLKSLRQRCRALTIIDTHFAIDAPDKYTCPAGHIFYGKCIKELDPSSTSGSKKAMWAGLTNDQSFWLSENSLANAISLAGFPIVARVCRPIFAWPWKDRATWIALGEIRPQCFYKGGFSNEFDSRVAVHPTVLKGFNWGIPPKPLATDYQTTDSEPQLLSEALFASFSEQIDILRASGKRFRIWWRDDDAHRETPELLRLLTTLRNIPIALAVIPGLLDSSLVRLLRRSDNITILQHGWKHINWAPKESRPSEYPETRNFCEVQQELRRGLAILDESFHGKFERVFVPPWHRYSSLFLEGKSDLKYHSVSRESPLFPLLSHGSGNEINVEIDTADWTNGGVFIGHEQFLRKLIQAFNIRLKWNAESAPIGLLTHHAYLTPTDCDQLKDIIYMLEGCAIVEWIGVKRMLTTDA